jgi:gluconate 2-dehydrogenase gamma chain
LEDFVLYIEKRLETQKAGGEVAQGPNSNSRRNFLRSGLIAISTATLSAEVTALPVNPPGDAPRPFLNESERRFLLAAVERLIPADEKWPGAAEAGVVNYIDLQMSGSWGKGEQLYRHGPFRKGTPSQGYQLEYTPAELFRRSILAIDKHFSVQGKRFDQLSPEGKDAYLTSLEKGGIDLDGVPSKTFFDFLLKHTVEGFFSDPIYGGNKNKISWKMIGFPGAYADYYDLIDKHGIELRREPLGIGDGAISHSMNAQREGN